RHQSRTSITPFVPGAASIAFTLIVAAYARRIYARRVSAGTLTGSIVGRQMTARHRPGGGPKSTNTGRGTYRTRITSEVPILRASKTATRGTYTLPIVSASGGGAATAKMITPCTIGMA